MREESESKREVRAKEAKRSWRDASALAGVGLGVVAIILALSLNSGTSEVANRALGECKLTPDASQGLSAYELWVSIGNKGSEADFLNSLVGTKGADGYVGSNGRDGADGKRGKSAYQLWLEAGNQGSADEFISALKGDPGADGVAGLSAYDLWIAQGNSGTSQDFFNSLIGPAGPAGANGANGADGAQGPSGAAGASGAPGASGSPGPAGLSAYEIWIANGHSGTETDFLTSLVGATGAAGAQGPAGVCATPSLTAAFGDSGSFWDTTVQGQDGLVSRTTTTAHPIYLGQADTANNQGVSVQTCSGDEAKPAGYPSTPRSCLTFTHPGVYNIAFSAQLYRTSGGNADVVSIWLRKDGVDVPDTNTDITLQSNGQKYVAAWNFFAPVTCNGSCSQYQLMWSYDAPSTNLWYQAAATNPTRPAIPSIIVTVNQVK